MTQARRQTREAGLQKSANFSKIGMDVTKLSPKNHDAKSLGIAQQ